jgi:hypothetical protein
MKVGVADAAEEDFDLHVLGSGFTTWDRSGGQRGRRTGGGVRLRGVPRLLLVRAYLPGPLLFVADGGHSLIPASRFALLHFFLQP